MAKFAENPTMVTSNFSLKRFNTFGLDVKARLFALPSSEQEIQAIISSGITRENQSLAIGIGSNLLFISNFDGIAIHPAIKGIATGKAKGGKIPVTVGAGVLWDDFVGWAVSNGLGGTENLSLIPGTTGASAVQNIGAYGAEVALLIDSVYAIDLSTGKRENFSAAECSFGYRMSIFKKELKGKVIITSVTFSLLTEPAFNLSYGNLQSETEKLGDITLGNIRKAVMDIRSSKLPDPSLTGNAGSFFKNPVVPSELALRIKESHPSMPVYSAGKGMTKLAAGWLIEQCGWKGYRKGDAGVHDKQALVLVNYGTATGREILSLSELIRESVELRFGVNLEREVEVI